MNEYNFEQFLAFLDKNQITAIIIGYIISIRIYDIINIFFDEIINQLIYIDFNSKNKNYDPENNGSKIKKIEKYEISFYNVKIKIGKIIVSILKFIFVTYVLFIIVGLINKMLIKIRVKNNQNLVKNNVTISQ